MQPPPAVPQLPAAPVPVPDDVLQDLRRRLRAHRPVPLPPLPAGASWDRGTDPAHLAELVHHWADAYDWRTHEERIRSWPWHLAHVAADEGSGEAPDAGETPVRAVHQRAAASDATAVLLLHGWPDSVLRFERVLPLLTRHHVVVPALPGFPFAAPVAGAGLSARQIAVVVAGLMADLGYARYVVSAGDVGSDVAEHLADLHPERVSALHLTDVSQYHFLVQPPSDPSPAEREYLAHGHDWQAREGGYMHEQRTKPHTLAVGLGDSPAGLLAWLLEKLRSWTDCGGDVEAVFSRDELLTWVAAYWVSGCIGTSFTPYATGGDLPQRVTPPAVFTVFPRDLVNAPEEFARRIFDVRSWRRERAGGHFAAWEQPRAYAAGVHEAVELAATSSR
ncbi:epoxide hydrolase family protein [Kineococcus sp. SYSU DK001]|uniref:epoxide hydrolase family protein n=1 Tax=Kineococcus sp. SYSU DK001 TaxID=3383122 RepID=UPI003D7E1105